MESFRAPPPMRFEGNISAEWMKFKKLFEIFLIASQKDEAKSTRKIAMLLNLIGEKGVEIYETLSLSGEDKKDFDKVISAFDAYCDPKKYTIYERFLFNSRKQQPGEPFSNFLADLKQQVVKCDFSDVAETIDNQMVRDRIVMGIHNGEVQEKLLRTDKLTLQKAIETCQVAEATHKQAQQLRQTQPVHEVRKAKIGHRQHNPTKNTSKDHQHKDRQDGEKFSSRTIRNCNKCSYTHKINRCPAFGKRCKRCGQSNHFAVVCSRHEVNRKTSSKQVAMVKNLTDDSGSEVSLSNLVIDSVIEDRLGTRSKFWIVKLKVMNSILDFKVDSGSEVNIISKGIFENLVKNQKNKPEIRKLENTIEAYGGFKLDVVGVTTLKVIYNDIKINTNFVIMNTESVPILGLDTSLKLNLIKRIYSIDAKNLEREKEKFISENSEVFKGLGCFPNTYRIQLKPNASPVIRPMRRIPLMLVEKVKAKLKEMEKCGIIRKVIKPVEWVHNLVVVEKPDKSIRLCLDPRDLNSNIIREPFPIPRISDVSAKLNKMEYYTVVDLKDGFYQIPLDEFSSDLCSFNTPNGCYQFRRLPFGLNCAPELFQKLNTEIFGDLPGIFIYFDDILVFGKTQREHDENLKNLMDRAKKKNVKLNPNKLQYCKSEVRYLGYIFTKKGVKIDPLRVKAIHDMQIPTNKKELQRFLGCINYLRDHIPNLSSLTSSFRELLKKNVVFKWLPSHSIGFTKLKQIIAGAPVLQPFQEQQPVLIQTDASQNGLGACLLQNKKPVCYSSKALSECEQRYAQIEKEMLAIVFACEKFHHFIYGRKVQIVTDHKPLIPIFKKHVSDIHSNRLQRMRLKLLCYDLEISYIPGKDLHLADTLSRNFNKEDIYEIDTSLNYVVHSTDLADDKLKNIQKSTLQDMECQLLIENCKKGWPNEARSVNDLIKKYWPIRNDIYFEEGILFFRNRIIVPYPLRKEILKNLHEGHFGSSKTKALAAQTLYWPNINVEIESFIKHCRICEKYQRANTRMPLIPHEVPDLPFNKVGVDILEYGGKPFIVLVDYYSKWIEIRKLKSKTAFEVTEKLKKIFSCFGIPEVIIADNMPFNSYQFRKFTGEWNIKLQTSSPNYPQSNGLAEKGVGIAKALLKKCQEESKDIYSGLLCYRNSPNPRIGYSPAQLLMSRCLRTKLPIKTELLKPKPITDIKELIIKNQNKYKLYHDQGIGKKKEVNYKSEDNVVFRKGKAWEPAKIVNPLPYPRSFEIQTEDKQILRRNSIHLRKSAFAPVFRSRTIDEDNDHTDPQFHAELNHATHSENYSENIIEGDKIIENKNNENNQQSYKTRYGRIVKNPDRFTYDK